MPFDAHRNLAISAVDIPPSPPESGTSLRVVAGQGSRFPAPPFNVTLWPAGQFPTPTSAEVARVTAVAGDDLTLLRAQEGTVARLVLAGDFIAETITAKALQDIESGQNFPLIQTPHVEATDSLLVGGDAQVNGSLTVNATITGQDVNGQQGNFNDINVAHLDADTLIATTSVTSPSGQFDFVNVQNTLNAASVTAQTVDASSQITAPVGRFGSLDTTPLNSANLSAPIPDAKLSVNVLKFTGGYPGGTVNFLRADGTFAPTSGGGGVPLHASTHVIGGTDTIPNVAWTNQANTFTANQTINGSLTLTGGVSTTTGNISTVSGTVSAAILSASNQVRLNNTAGGSVAVFTTDGSDTGILQVSGGGFATANRGAYINLAGNENGVIPGQLGLAAGTTGIINFITGADVQRGIMHPSGGFSWGSATDPGPGSISVFNTLSAGQVTTTGSVVAAASVVAGSMTSPGTGNLGAQFDLVFSGPAGHHNIRPNTADGADSGDLAICGGGGSISSQGAYIALFGNEKVGAQGLLQLIAGNAINGRIEFYTGVTALRGQIFPSGGLSWGGGSFDAGAGSIFVGTGTNADGEAFIMINPAANGLINMSVPTSAAANHIIFRSPSGTTGFIQSTGGATTYATSSDQRLKIDRGPLPNDIIDRLVVHAFDWTADGSPGRGLFAQEAIEVAPHAVSVGTDDGLPWGVDYSKLVPDLIVALQQLQGRVADLEAR